MAAAYHEGTIKGKNPDEFNDEEACKKLRKAMKGLGTDENAIIQVLAEHNNLQRQLIKHKYSSMYGRDLIEDLKSELAGLFLTLCLYTLMPARYFDAFCLYNASVAKTGTREETLIDILSSRSNMEIEEIKEHYKKELFKADLEDHLRSELSGDFQRVMIALAQGRRSQEQIVDEAVVDEDVKALYDGGVRTTGTDEDAFIRILVTRSVPHLQKVFEKYRSKDQKGIEEAIKSETTGDFEDALLAIVEFARDPVKYFAQCFHQSMYSLPTNDARLMELVVSHCEVDLKDIGDAYLKIYKKSLPIDISDHTRGDYGKLMMRLVNPQ